MKKARRSELFGHTNGCGGSGPRNSFWSNNGQCSRQSGPKSPAVVVELKVESLRSRWSFAAHPLRPRGRACIERTTALSAFPYSRFGEPIAQVDC